MNRSEYAFTPLSEGQYDALITAGSMDGNTSPLHGTGNYQAFIGACRGINCDPRVLLSGLLWEDHFATDPNGSAAASANNLSGIKWAGQTDAVDSGIAADNGGTYARFPTLAEYFQAYAQTLTNEYCGPAFQSGDLAGAWAIYVGGPANPNAQAGADRVAQWRFYQAKYPASAGGGTAVVYASAVVAAAKAHLGESHESDSWNGDHPVSMYCEADVEDWLTEAGVPDVPHYATAAVAGDASPLQSGPAPAGSQVFFRGPGWSSDDHTGISLGEGLTISGLATVQVTAGWQDPAVGYRGWRWTPGVEADPAPAPVVQDTFYQEGNPYGAVPLKAPFWNRWFALENLKGGLGTAMMGYAMAAETATASGRRVQRFERGWYGTQQAPDPWDCVQLLASELPVASGA